MKLHIEEVGPSRYEPFVVVENEYIEDMMVSVLIWSKAGFAKGIQGTESLVKPPEASIPFRRRDGPEPKPTTCYKRYPSGYVLPYHYKNPVSGK